MGCVTVANDLNPVAALLLNATINWPSKFSAKLTNEFQDLCDRFIDSATPKYEDVFPPISEDIIIRGYMWARTIICPYCSGLVPLSPNWKLAPDGTGVKLRPQTSNGLGSDGRICSFEIVKSVLEQSERTVSGGDGMCPYPDCRRVIDGKEIKSMAKAGQMGEQLYAIAYKKRTLLRTKTGKQREKWVKAYRVPEPEDDNSKIVQIKLEEKLLEWDTRDIIPSEKFPSGSDNRPIEYGMPKWQDLFSPRQLLCHGTSVKVFRDLLDEDRKNGNLTDMRKAAYVIFGNFA